MGIKTLALFAAIALALQAGLALAASPPAAAPNTTSTDVFAVNKTGKNIYLVLDQKGGDSFQAIKYIPANVAGSVSATPRAWFRAYTSYEYTARLFLEDADTPFCTVDFHAANYYGSYPTVVDMAINKITGTCQAQVMINDHARNTSCQLSLTAN